MTATSSNGSGDFTAYIVVGGPDNFERTRALGFSMHGMKSTRRKMAMGIKPGDRLIFYLTGLKRFGGVARVTSEPFEDHTPIWSNPKKAGEDYPYRVKLEAETVLDEATYVDAQPVAARMAYTQKWPRENWTLAFQGNLHRISREDYDLIASELREAASVKA
jgi:predicted RNA-binding protein